MLKAIKHKILYNPYKVAAKDSRITIAKNTILLKSTRFDFKEPKGSIQIDADSMVACSFILEANGAEIHIGKRCWINSSHLICKEKIIIGDDVTMAWGIYIYDHNSHSLDWNERANDIALQNRNFRESKPIETDKNWSTVKSAPIVIRDKAWIGFEAVIMKGVTIGEGAVVGARAVVTKDVAPYTVVMGNPAVEIRKI